MVKVPTYGSDDAGRVGRISLTREPQARQSVETVSDAFGAGIGSGLAGLAKDASEGVQDVVLTQRRAEEKRKREAEIEQAKRQAQATANMRKLKAELKADAAAKLDELEQGIGMAEDEEQLQAATDQLIEFSHSHPYMTSMLPEEREVTVRARASKAYGAFASRIEEPRAIADFAEKYKGTMDYDDYTRIVNAVQPALEAEQADVDAGAILSKHLDVNSHNAEDIGKAPPAGDIRGLVTSIIIPKYEGTATVVDSNGAKVRMGVNAAHNPGVNLAKLTPDAVAKLYEEKYWKPIAGEKIPPEMQLAALDMSIMAGPAQTKKLLQRANGDLDKFTQLRQEFLAGLIKSNPAKYARYAKSWANRVADGDRWGQNVRGGSDGSLNGSKAAALAQLNATAEAEGWSPRRLKLARAGVETRFKDMKLQADAMKEESEETILDYLRANDPQSVADALKDPTFRAAYDSLGPKGKNWADDLVAKDSKVEQTEENQLRYLDLWGMSGTNPKGFLEATKDIARDKTLTMDQRKTLITKRTELLKPKAASTKAVNAKTIMGLPTIRQALNDAGISSKDTKKNPRGLNYNVFYAELQMKLDAAAAENGGKLTQQEAEKIAQSMFTGMKYTDTILGMTRPSWLGGKTTYGSKYKRPRERMTEQDRSAVVKYLQSKGMPVTQMNVERTWLAGQ